MMRTLTTFGLMSLAFGIYMGCSDVAFEAVKTPPCRDVDGGVCIEDGDPEFDTYLLKFKSGQVDILFVVDNSGSMSTEHKHMANRFPSFLNSIANLDYQIAVVTTDISVSPGNATPRAANGFGTLQDGKFIAFPNGSKIMTSATHEQNLAWFQKTIQRNETLVCDANGYKKEFCPSSDERGIYAINMAIDRSENASFFRNTSPHLALVILSDEDERGDGRGSVYRPMEPYDEPATLVTKLRNQLSSMKTMSAHAVVIKPGDTACYNSQYFIPQGSSFPVIGKYGAVYTELVYPSDALKAKGNIVTGVLGSICASDYGAQLGQIGKSVAMNTGPVQLPCRPKDNQVKITFAAYPSAVPEYTIDTQNRLTFSPPPGHTNVLVEVQCPKKR